MKHFFHEIIFRRKTIVVFILAIFLPSLIVGYLSLNTVSRRRDSVKNLLESNLWISGEAALQSLERALQNYEQDVIKKENFIRLIQPQQDYTNGMETPVSDSPVRGRFFLLDSEYGIIYPKTASQVSTGTQWDEAGSETSFVHSLQKAESLEFAQQDASGAAEVYRTCLSSAPSKEQRAVALEGLARCLISLNNFPRAREIYLELSEQYSKVMNKAGHPYGIVAGLQLAESARSLNQKDNDLSRLINLYRKLKQGNWLLTSASFDFFTSEMETILDERINREEYPQLHRDYRLQKDGQSPYKKRLAFIDFVENRAIPAIKEKISVPQAAGPGDAKRILLTRGSDFHLISFTVLSEFRPGRSFIGGFQWDFHQLQNNVIPGIMDEMSRESGLQFQIIHGDEIQTVQSDDAAVSQTRLFSFREFPLPWRLSVSQPEIRAVERSAHREMFLYGSMLIVIVVLMLLGVFLIIRDITRESETTRLKTEFVHNISHELKTPLTLIRLYGETLQRKKNLTKKEKNESYEIITKESERLSHMVNNVLDFSRIEMGRKEFHLKKGKIDDIVRDTLESYLYHLEKKGFTVHSEIGADIPELEFDPEAIASVLVNLLSNAIKFSPEKKEVWIRLLQQNGTVFLQVEDRGIGIKQKEQSRIFQRFYRSKDDIVSETSGSGLGLPLVKHIVEAHGGEIHIESEVGKGSTFSVILPLSMEQG